jgi:hypothetical protein
MSAQLTQLSPQRLKIEATEQMIIEGARAAFDALINGNASGPLRFDQLPHSAKERVMMRFAIGLRAALHVEPAPPKRYSLTPRQRQLLGVIAQHMDAHGQCPTYREMCAYMNLRSKDSIARMVKGLEERGYIRRLPNRYQSIEIIHRES